MAWTDYGNRIGEPTMTEAVEGGAALAWRLLATLEGGSLVLAATALLAYTARSRARRERRPVRSVLVTNTTIQLGKELKRRFESCGCVVSTVTSGAGAEASAEAGKVDALVIVGAESQGSGLEGIAGLVSEDVYDNLKLLDSLSPRVHRGGYLAWACAGAATTDDVFIGAANAFDSALRASLQHAAKRSHCEPIWIGRCETAELAAERIVAALVPHTTHQVTRFSIRNAAYKVSGYVGRWLKIVA